MSTAQRNGVLYPRRLGAAPYTSPSGQHYRLEHWAIMEAIRRWYARGPGGLYGRDGGFLAPSIEHASGCATAEAARELIALLEASDRPSPGPSAAGPCVLAFRPYPDALFLIEQHPELPGAPWLVSSGGRHLRADELAPAAGWGGPDAWERAGAAPPRAEFATADLAQRAVLAMAEARRPGRFAARLREWADRVERGELSAAMGTVLLDGGPGAEPDSWVVEFRVMVPREA